LSLLTELGRLFVTLPRAAFVLSTIRHGHRRVTRLSRYPLDTIVK
jgi:hypothetical protein